MTKPVADLWKFANRLWYYFRLGYGTYLTFFLGAINTLTVVYYLLIKNAPALEAGFPRFVEFAILATAIGVPLSVLVGWLHMKGSLAMTSEMDISVEANHCYYKLPPGYYR